MSGSLIASSRAIFHWYPAPAARPLMGPAWWRWISSQDSLTARLIQAAGDAPFRVKLIDQGIARPHRDEAQALGIGLQRLAWYREVALCIGERPWVAARSVAPLSGLRGQRLDRLGERSLGSWLFRQPDLERGPIEVTRHDPAFYPANICWGRRSVLKHRRLRILVQEFFLDAMADELQLASR